MPNAELTGLAPEQCGGHAHQSAPACGLRKQTGWEIARYNKMEMAGWQHSWAILILILTISFQP